MLQDRDALAINICRCPVGDYFKAQGEAKLMQRTWCMLDFALAQAMFRVAGTSAPTP